MRANGRLMATSLVTVQRGEFQKRRVRIQLERHSAASYKRMVSALRREGHAPVIALPAGGYRSRRVLIAMIEHPGDWNVLKGIALADPRRGQTSKHGYGRAADIYGVPLDVLVRVGRDYGWSRDNPDGDPHHFRHDGRTRSGRFGLKPGLSRTMGFPSPVVLVRLQRALKRHGTVTGMLGVANPNTVKGVQTVLKEADLWEHRIDGRWTALLGTAVQKYARKGGYTGPVNGTPGPFTWAGFLKRLGERDRP